jgi:hypothetical protein
VKHIKISVLFEFSHGSFMDSLHLNFPFISCLLFVIQETSRSSL